MKYNHSLRKMLVKVAVISLCAAMVHGQKKTIKLTPPELKSFKIVSGGGIDSMLASWTTYNILHMDPDKVKAELTSPERPKKVHIYLCGNGAGVQQNTAKDLASYADVLSYLAFRYHSNNKPKEDELLWGGYDNPFINHARKMSQLVGVTPLFAYLSAAVDGNKRRPALLEEVQWKFIASLGCGYRCVEWPSSNNDAGLENEYAQIAKKIRPYCRSLVEAKPVNWATTKKDQPIMATACKRYLFVFLLNGAYMTLGEDSDTVVIPLEKASCEGIVTLSLPEGITVRRGVTLKGKSLRLNREKGKITAPYSFNAGGEMLIFTLRKKTRRAPSTQPTTKPTTQPANVENKQ